MEKMKKNRNYIECWFGSNKKKGTCDVEQHCCGEGRTMATAERLPRQNDNHGGTTATVERPSRQQRYRNEEAPHKKQHKEPTQDGCFFCGAEGHKKKHCTNYHAWRAKKGPFAKFLEECGIVPQYTMPGSPTMNGVAERRNIRLKDMKNRDGKKNRSVFDAREKFATTSSVGSTQERETVWGSNAMKKERNGVEFGVEN
ncbi:Retrovirus-related Pol polyprotein from transposon TNT 1-94 [Senna tora]|uniref:Retrovirus-related Pol polyprotein from transposon TNT 1-94 n=1 Tax=Senna tora TaxID=362788 RepID=A0A834WJ00_9FABA|nr:Retrovirus-related Pol polyprotein from transposon TNT 1-94 [Senna tora]